MTVRNGYDLGTPPAISVALEVKDGYKLADYRHGVRDGYYQGRAEILGAQPGVLDAYRAGVEEGHAAGIGHGIAAGESIIPPSTPPTLTVVSPTPGVQPGQAGGFPADYFSAKTTPIVLQVTDASPGLQYIGITVTFTYADGTKLVEPVYRRGNFVGLYAQMSYVVAITNGLELHCQRTGGWPGTTSVMPMQFDIDALDKAGSMS